MPVTAAEVRIFLEQSFLHIKAEMLRFVIFIADFNVGCREPVHLSITEKHVKQRLATILGLPRNEFLGPDLFDREVLGELHKLPQIGTRIARSDNELMPE